MYIQNKNRLTNTENKLVVIKREREAGWSEGSRAREEVLLGPELS